jgi:hypothetical protein
MKPTTVLAWLMALIVSVLFGESWKPFVRLFLLVLAVVPLTAALAVFMIWLGR